MSEIDELREWVRSATLAWALAEQALGTDVSAVVESQRQRALALIDAIQAQVDQRAVDLSNIERD
jgi:hypothetical protein